ncbi:MULTISPECIES: DNA polymerase III subunit delta' [unclassified Coleofasciculus]|uniref:DNA polymerase III subunit delta' n=1 Tax=unclassified Coleofasciculus TaxID=2692782 RepID=UPI00188103E7|nr:MULTISPECIES: DNA polymerase III subunit delta' [unclassified Coleofasciculus]MBE9127906.1 DNA polymerase III subunit delta' [Coleofasciculus sp. LEGE 07081]MBE9148071.1 DNA polymerase III subunit delta' [Coleofasciculus sp. LEGE 07092]
MINDKGQINSFASLIGQSQAIALLEGAVKANRVAPAYLFAGSPGVGRGLAARAFIELLFFQDISPEKQPLVQKRLQQGNHPDVLWVEPTYLQNGVRLSAAEAAEKGLKRKTPPQIRLEQIREIAQFLSRSPLEVSRQVVVLEAAETMAEAAANGLLKTLEEPGRATLILIAPSPESLLPTLVSRCQRIPFYRLAQGDMAEVLRQRGYEEILQEPSVLAIAQGSPGGAIAAFAQLQAIPPELLTKLTQLPNSSRAALELAKEIDKTLDPSTQVWLTDYLQHSYWQHRHHRGIIQKLEQARTYLLKLVQPRLVWEVTLLELSQEG